MACPAGATHACAMDGRLGRDAMYGRCTLLLMSPYIYTLTIAHRGFTWCMMMHDLPNCCNTTWKEIHDTNRCRYRCSMSCAYNAIIIHSHARTCRPLLHTIRDLNLDPRLRRRHRHRPLPVPRGPVPAPALDLDPRRGMHLDPTRGLARALDPRPLAPPGAPWSSTAPLALVATVDVRRVAAPVADSSVTLPVEMIMNVIRMDGVHVPMLPTMPCHRAAKRHHVRWIPRGAHARAAAATHSASATSASSITRRLDHASAWRSRVPVATSTFARPWRCAMCTARPTPSCTK
jgi:hypothetical protein